MIRPIIFSGAMVRALLDGRKTQTRRVLRGVDLYEKLRASPFVASGIETAHGREVRVPFAPGDRLWVREGWTLDDDKRPVYRADRLVPPPIGPSATSYGQSGPRLARWRSPLHMPRWASRLTLAVTEVRVQRLHEITEADAVAEGVERPAPEFDPTLWRDYQRGGDCDTARVSFETLWNSLHGPDAWDANPWVAAVSFTVERRNIDAGAAT